MRQPVPNRFLGLPGSSGLPAPGGLLIESGDKGLQWRPKVLLMEAGSSGTRYPCHFETVEKR